MSDDLGPVDPRLREFAMAPGPGPDFEAIARGSRRRRTRRVLAPLAAAAVILLIVGVVAAIALQGRAARLEPVQPLPAPTSAQPTPAPTTPEFAVEDATANGRPTAGLGETMQGLRADGVTFETTTCPDGATCPVSATLTLTNTGTQAFGGGIIVSVYRDGTEVTGTGSGIQVPPGETGTVTIVLDPALADAIMPGGTPGTYTWNWMVE